MSELHTSSFAIKKGLFYFVFHIFHKRFFAALKGSILCNITVTKVFEVNVKFVATWVNQWKRNDGEKM